VLVIDPAGSLQGSNRAAGEALGLGLEEGAGALEGLDPAAGPYWRAKVLGVKSHALIVQGSPGAALDSLAEAYGLVTELPGDAYNRGSACHVVGLSLSSALLFGPALELLRAAQRVLGPRGGGDVNGAIEESVLFATWGLFLEFLGRDAEADARFAACRILLLISYTYCMDNK